MSKSVPKLTEDELFETVAATMSGKGCVATARKQAEGLFASAITSLTNPRDTRGEGMSLDVVSKSG
jgi:hypothetical protein